MRVLTRVQAILLTVASFLRLAQTSAVRIHAVDPFGRGIGPISVTRFVESRAGGKRDYSAQFVDGRATGIPLGEYVASVRAGGIQLGGPVKLTDSETFIVLSGSGQSNEYGPGRVPVLKGKLINVPEGTPSPIWLRIFNLYENVDSSKTLCWTRYGLFGSYLESRCISDRRPQTTMACCSMGYSGWITHARRSRRI